MPSPVLYEQDGHVVTITYNRPEALNAVNGEVRAGLNDAWEFLNDPIGVGESLGWYKTQQRGGNWQSILTSSKSWSDQGLRYFKSERVNDDRGGQREKSRRGEDPFRPVPRSCDR